MWVKCHICKGKGHKDNSRCFLCNKGDIFDDIMAGFIYVRDKKSPVTPPNSPRQLR